MNTNNVFVGWTEVCRKGDEVGIEVDLRSKNKEDRRIRFIINGIVQRTTIIGLPECIRFGVSFIPTSLLFHFPHLFILSLSLSLCCIAESLLYPANHLHLDG